MDEQVAKILLDIDAVSINTTVPFKYASGVLSPIYVDCRIINSFPKKRKIVIEHLVKEINTKVNLNKIDVLVGSGHSGISLSAFISEKLGKPMAYARTSVKSYGKQKAIEGIVNQGSSVLIVTDIYGTEGHIIQAIKALKALKCDILGVAAFFSLKIGEVEQFLEKNNIPQINLTDISELIKIAERDEYISLFERKEIEKWIKNKQGWAVAHVKEIEKKIEYIKKDVARRLLEIKAITLNLKEPYTYTTGIRSPIYCDNRLLISYPKHEDKIVEYMANIIINHIGTNNIDIIGGTSTAGIPHAAILSERMNLPMIYIKGKKSEHGKHAIIEGQLKSNQRVLVVEDLISTGGSSMSAVNTVREAGGIVDHCLAIFTYQLKKAEKAFRDGNCTLHTLSEFSSLMSVAEEKAFISSEEKKRALEWNKDPAGWGPKHGFPLGEKKN